MLLIVINLQTDFNVFIANWIIDYLSPFRQNHSQLLGCFVLEQRLEYSDQPSEETRNFVVARLQPGERVKQMATAAASSAAANARQMSVLQLIQDFVQTFHLEVVFLWRDRLCSAQFQRYFST